MLNRLLKKLQWYYYTSNSERFLDKLRMGGVRIGRRTYCIAPKTVQIDTTRPELLEIGEHVFIHKGTIILTHDWASWCFVEKYNEFIPAHSKVKIGNNVWFGENVTVMPGVTIGNNVIVGIGSIVTKSIPANSVAVGIPARVVCTIDEYFEKRKAKYVNECIEYARAIFESGREPLKADFYDDYPSFVDGENMDDYNYPYRSIFMPNQLCEWRKNHRKIFDSFEDFINHVKAKRQ